MYHSITFITGGNTNPSNYLAEVEKNTWDDWHLIPTSRPVFSPPSVKTEYIDIPNADGSIDLTEFLTEVPSFEYREGSLEFLVENGHRQWYDTYSEIMDFLHGKYAKAILEDDPLHYYEGRFSVSQWKSEQHNSLITIDYKIKPFCFDIQEGN